MATSSNNKSNERVNNQVVNNAKQEIREACKQAEHDVKKRISPFYFINELNRLSKKNEYVDKTNLATMSKALKNLSGGRYGFDASMLKKDSKGRFVYNRPVKFSYLTTDLADCRADFVAESDKGEDVICTAAGLRALHVVPLTLPGFVRAFKQVLLDSMAQAEALEKLQKKQDKAREAAKKMAIKDYNDGRISEVELAERLAAIK